MNHRKKRGRKDDFAQNPPWSAQTFVWRCANP